MKDHNGTIHSYEEKYIELKHLLRCYLHEDMHLDYIDVEESLKDYVLSENKEVNYVNEVLQEIDDLRNKKHDADQLKKIIDHLGCGYKYEKYYTPEQWLDYIFKTLKDYQIKKQQFSIR